MERAGIKGYCVLLTGDKTIPDNGGDRAKEK